MQFGLFSLFDFFPERRTVQTSPEENHRAERGPAVSILIAWYQFLFGSV